MQYSFVSLRYSAKRFRRQLPILTLLGLAVLLGCVRAGARAGAEPTLPETYRLRVENTQYGRVEISADGGAHYILVGRVLKPATAMASEKVATTPGSVLRSSHEGIAFAVLPGRTLKLRPQTAGVPPPTRRGHHPTARFLPPEPSAIVTNLEPDQGVFGSLLPPFRSPVRLQTGPDYLATFSDAYTPTEDDAFVFLVSLPAASATADAQARQELAQRLAKLGQTYAAGAAARARAEHRPIVNGTLTLQAKLPPNEPDPIAAVTFTIDGNVVAAQNTPPYTYAWDTRQVADGEHVIEARALNGRGSLLTHTLKLLVVQNSAQAVEKP